MRLKKGNCIKWMKKKNSKIPDKYYDLCLTDPPWNVNKTSSQFRDIDAQENDNMSSEEYKQFSTDWFAEAMRISKGIILFPGRRYLKMWHTEFDYPKENVVWYNPSNSSPGRNRMGGRIHWDPILVYGDVILTKDAFKANSSKQALFKLYGTRHPNMKPIPLIMDILNSCYTKPKKVIDPFMGIGTTLIACKRLGIDCDGIEIKQKWFDEAALFLTERYNTIEQFF